MSYTRETRENETNDLFQTHYYKTNYDAMKQAITEFLKKSGFVVGDFNDDYGEVQAFSKKMNTSIKIIMQNPRETSIDFFVEYMGFFGRKKEVAIFLARAYNFLAKHFEFKGLGLHQ